MAAPAEQEFDPLRDLAGMWTTALAERYLPLPGHPKVKYECWDGRLYMSPVEAAANSYGRAELIGLMRQPARAAGLFVFAEVNLLFAPQRWIQPDVTILHRPPSIDDDAWVPVDHCTMPVEFVSPSSRRRDYIDKRDLCASAGVPYFMQVEIERRLGHSTVTLLELGPDKRYRAAAHAIPGQVFEMMSPFELSFDPAVLLVP